MMFFSSLYVFIRSVDGCTESWIWSELSEKISIELFFVLKTKFRANGMRTKKEPLFPEDIPIETAKTILFSRCLNIKHWSFIIDDAHCSSKRLICLQLFNNLRLLFKGTLTIQPLWWYHVYIWLPQNYTMHMIYTISKVWKWAWTRNGIALLGKKAPMRRYLLYNVRSFKHCVFSFFFFIWFQCGKTLIIAEILSSFLLFCTYRILLNVSDWVRRACSNIVGRHTLSFET